MPTHVWYKLKRTRVLELLKTRASGLSNREVALRRKQHGLNELARGRRVGWLVVLGNQFRGALVYILITAAVISALLQDYVDMGVILAAVALNVIVGFIQEYRAMNAMAKLRSAMRFQALAIRDGEECLIDAVELVPGDIIILRVGYKVPADIRIIECADLEISEARLTGESEPVKKDFHVQSKELVLADRVNMAYMGSDVVGGLGRGVVCETGVNTEIGRIASLLKDIKEEQTPLQRQLDYLGKTIGLIVLIVCFVVLVAGLVMEHGFREMFSTSVAIAVASVPEELAVGVTVVLAVGMQRILKQKALVRKLVAAETLGSTTVICTDKTGTLTEGAMRVVRIITNNHELEAASTDFNSRAKEIGDRASFMTALKIGILCNDGHVDREGKPTEKWTYIGTPTERALLQAGSEVGQRQHRLEKEYPRVATIPFSSEQKFMITMHREASSSRVAYLKGAPEVVMGFIGRIDIDGQVVPFTSEARTQIKKRYEKLSAEGLRTLALAYLPNASPDDKLPIDLAQSKDFVFVGLMGIMDPVRSTAKQTIAECRSAGLHVVMITGDHKFTAQAIARELGLPSKSENIMEGSELQKLNHGELKKRVRDISVYARATPEDKLRIVRAWQSLGEVVAMTGDGVNDAPALHSANVGVALGSGTDIAKETADIVMLDDNFATIVAAIRQGRVIFDNIRKMVLYLLSDSMAAVVVIAGSLIIGLPLPLLPVQILWINLVTDGFPVVALTQETDESDVMQRPPISRRVSIINLHMKTVIAVISSVAGLLTLGVFTYYYQVSDTIDLARTMAFATLGMSTIFTVYSCRTLRTPIWRANPFANKALTLAVSASLIFQLSAIYLPGLSGLLGSVPLGWSHWGVVLASVISVLVLIEVIKGIFIKNQTHELE